MFQRQSESANASRHYEVNKEFSNYPKSTQANCDQNEFTPKYKHNNNSSERNNNKWLLADSCSMSDDAEVDVDTNCAAYSSSAKDR